MEDTLIFDGGRTTRPIRNITHNSNVGVHLESGTEVVTIEGTCEILSQPSRAITEPVAQGYTDKYQKQGYAPSPDSWDEGGLYRVIPRQIIAWTDLVFNPTKFVFD